MKSQRFAQFAWIVVAYNVLVVLWGAFVRATGSGAGCGSHWPLCNGVVVPQSPQVATLIEFGHRLTSGLSILLIAMLAVWAFRLYPKRHRVRRAAVWSGFFIFTEALIGAGLVLFSLVAHNESVARVWSHAAHLVNTFVLIMVLTLTAWWASGGKPVRLRGHGSVGALLSVALLGTLLLGATGAITALGDTLFPSATLSAGIAQDFSATSHFLTRLRVIHPVLAITLGVYIVVVARIVSSMRPNPDTRRFARLLIGLFGMQFVIGMANVGLLAPIWMQLIHLLMADLLWIALVLLGASAMLAEEVPAAGVAAAGERAGGVAIPTP
ncbi:MAG: COX15/CtaA family protein [Herpetosiphonaceae bacterium]|nr:COX15/CtaA family protein [Herpetosiphonaceae bacterium]